MLASDKSRVTIKCESNKYFIDEDGLVEITADGRVLSTENYLIVDGRPVHGVDPYAKGAHHFRR